MTPKMKSPVRRMVRAFAAVLLMTAAPYMVSEQRLIDSVASLPHTSYYALQPHTLGATIWPSNW